jgi:phytoene synthase
VEDLQQFHITLEQLTARPLEQRVTLDERGLMAMEAGRAREYYKAADNLLPLIEPDSRAALWVLVTIYRRLLQRIENVHYEVFAKRVSVPTAEKLWILARGLWMAFRLRFVQTS